MMFDAHERAFAFFRKACTRGIQDDLKAELLVDDDLFRTGSRRAPAKTSPT